MQNTKNIQKALKALESYSEAWKHRTGEYCSSEKGRTWKICERNVRTLKRMMEDAAGVESVEKILKDKRLHQIKQNRKNRERKNVVKNGGRNIKD